MLYLKTDEHLSIVQYLKEAGITGAVIVTTPQEVSLLDVRKEITFCRKVNVEIIGVIENMSGFVCPKCHVSVSIIYNCRKTRRILASVHDALNW